mgnify:FL=1
MTIIPWVFIGMCWLAIKTLFPKVEEKQPEQKRNEYMPAYILLDQLSMSAELEFVDALTIADISNKARDVIEKDESVSNAFIKYDAETKTFAPVK